MTIRDVIPEFLISYVRTIQAKLRYPEATIWSDRIHHSACIGSSCLISGGAEIVYPVHPIPNVRRTVIRHLEGKPNISLLDPIDYVPFVDLMGRAYLLLTDSGGIQEEAPSLGKPVLVLREKTERPEAVSAGTARLVGTDERRIVEGVEQLLDDPYSYRRMARRHNTYGDGKASERIANVLAGATDELERIRLGDFAGGSTRLQASCC
jgi:UDP-N-acetylglucosamine 2-epimerase